MGKKVKKFAIALLVLSSILMYGCGRVANNELLGNSPLNFGNIINSTESTVSGTVQNLYGDAVEGAKVRLVRVDNYIEERQVQSAFLEAGISQTQDETVITVETDSSGSFSVDQVPVGTYRISAFSSDNSLSGTMADVTVGIQPTLIGTLAIGDPGSVSGRVTLEGESDYSNIVVGLLGISPAVLTDSNGNFSITNVPPDTYTVAFVKQGFITATTSVVVTENTNSSIPNVALSRLVSNDGPDAPIVTGVVNGQTYTTPVVANVQSVSGVTFVAKINGEYYSLGSKYRVEAANQNLSVQAIKLDNGMTASTAVSFTTNYGNVIGKVADSSLVGLANVQVVLIDESDSEIVATVVTDSNGNFTFANVPDATYTIKAQSNTNYAEATGVVLSGAGVVNAGTLVQVTAGTIEGDANLKGESNDSMILVEVVNTNIMAFTDSNGNYELRGVPAGTHTLRFSKDSYGTVTLANVVVVTGETTTAEDVDLYYESNEFMVNTTTAGDQEDVEIAALTNGGYAVVWTDALTTDIYVQTYDADDNKVGVETRVNPTSADECADPKIAPLTGGGFVVVWETNNKDGDGYAVMCRAFGNNGQPTTYEVRVNSYTAGDQTDPDVAGLSSGRFVVVWESDDQDTDKRATMYQVMNANGTKFESEYVCNSYTKGDQENPRVAASKTSDSFAVVWASQEQEGDADGMHNVYAQTYTYFNAFSNYWRSGVETRINTTTTGDQDKIDIDGLIDGGYIITWEHTLDDVDVDVYSQRVNSALVKVGSEVQVNGDEDNHGAPAAIGMTDGGYIITWSRKTPKDGGGNDDNIYMERYDSNNNVVVEEIMVNELISKDQKSPAVARKSNGELVYVWMTDDVDGDGTGIFGLIK